VFRVDCTSVLIPFLCLVFFPLLLPKLVSCS
jgi:hypothetical protein